MGVTGLWPVLSELCETKPLTYLTGKYVAVDLSGWVVKALSCGGVYKYKNPHLRNLFFRVSRLLQFGVNPIFVTEGKPPALKEATLKARNHDRCTGDSDSNTISRSDFDKTLQQCQEFLTCLGVPCVKSSGEAEAFCGFLCLKGVVSGVITEDNDAFLYGADEIYKDFSIQENVVNVYCLKSEKNKLQLDREKLVALALLLGCDYSKGVPSIGKVKAVRFISELKCEDVLQRFRDWKNLSESELFPGLRKEYLRKSTHCHRCGHLGTFIKHKKGGCSSCNSEIPCYVANCDNSWQPCSCEWHIIEEEKLKWKTELKIYNSVKESCPDFPDEKVIDEYLNFNDSVHDKELKRNCPDFEKFQEKALNYFSWTFENSWEKVLPLITSWQQYMLRNNLGDKANFIYEPVEILKEHLQDVTYYDVQWKVIENDRGSNFPSENLVTKEYGEQFSACYKEIVEEFKRKGESQANGKLEKFKANEGYQTVDEYFRKKSNTESGNNSKRKECMTSLENNGSSYESGSHFDKPNPKRVYIGPL